MGALWSNGLKMQHYYSKKQDSPFVLRELKLNIHGNELLLYSAPGVFSPKRIDKGSEILIRYSKLGNCSKILDLGCSYGCVGIAVAKIYSKAEVILSDINERAVKLANMNIKRNNIANAKAIVSDGFEKLDNDFCSVLLNPPQSAGKKLCIRLIEDSYYGLKKKGSLQLIARKNKGGQSLAKDMERVFGNVSVLAKKSGYWLYFSEKKA